MKRTNFLIAAIWMTFYCLFSASPANAQYAGKKNTIYVNATNPLLFGSKAFIVGYERVIGKH